MNEYFFIHSYCIIPNIAGQSNVFEETVRFIRRRSYKSTGIVTSNPDFDGVNLIFDLPLDPSGGDFEKAQKYLDSLWDDKEENSAEDTWEKASGDNKTFELYEYGDKGIGVSHVMTL